MRWSAWDALFFIGFWGSEGVVLGLAVFPNLAALRLTVPSTVEPIADGSQSQYDGDCEEFNHNDSANLHVY